MTDTADALRDARERFATCDLPGAERVCRDVLVHAPQSSQALHLLGRLASRKGNTGEAIQYVQRAITVDGRDASLFTDLAELFVSAGNASGAEAAYAKAISLAPRFAEAHYGFGRLQLAQGAVQKAIASLRRAVNISPHWAQAHLALARALRTAHRLQESLESAERASQLKAHYAEAFLFIAQLYRQIPDVDRALDQVQRALVADSRYAPAYCELGAICVDLNRTEDAVNYFREALWIDPSFAAAHVGLGNALRLGGRLKDAADSFLCAERINQKLPGAHIGLGMIADAQGYPDEALRRFDAAIEASKDSPAHYNRALTLLHHGRLAEGWREYEWRWTSPVFKTSPRHQKIARWRGQSLTGRKVLVWGEQGVGDEIIYSTMIPDLIARGAAVTIECDPRLAPLFRRTWPDVAVVEESPAKTAARVPTMTMSLVWTDKEFQRKGTSPTPTSRPPARLKGIQYQIAAGSLGEYIRPDFQSFPKRGQFLKPDADRVADLRQTLRGEVRKTTDLLVGISWLSNTPMAAAQKSTTLEAWTPILKQSGARFVDLQYGDTAEERAELARRSSIDLLHLAEIDLTDDLDGVAALISACDLIISVSNTTVHLAGAVGAPVWALLPPPAVQPWYWFAEGETSPWYDSVRLLRPTKNDGWGDVIKRAAAELRAHLKQ